MYAPKRSIGRDMSWRARLMEPAAKTLGRSCDDLIAAVNAAAGKRRLTHSDRLRLDVAVSQDRSGEDGEMYSWVGEERFRGRDLFEIVPDGAMATGTFSSMLASIFGGDAGRFPITAIALPMEDCSPSSVSASRRRGANMGMFSAMDEANR